MVMGHSRKLSVVYIIFLTEASHRPLSTPYQVVMNRMIMINTYLHAGKHVIIRNAVLGSLNMKRKLHNMFDLIGGFPEWQEEIFVSGFKVTRLKAYKLWYLPEYM